MRVLIRLLCVLGVVAWDWGLIDYFTGLVRPDDRAGRGLVFAMALIFGTGAYLLLVVGLNELVFPWIAEAAKLDRERPIIKLRGPKASGSGELSVIDGKVRRERSSDE